MDAADQMIAREMYEIAVMKREQARAERMKALKRTKNAKSASSDMVSKGSCKVPYEECYHKVSAPIARSNTFRNPDRLFWECRFWKTANCWFFKWLPRDAAEIYINQHGLEGVEVFDNAASLELAENGLLLTE